ncbi:MAG: lytic murein transglycosylase B [Francisellaceae bacterium]|jgi:membrane-bound lytic murein transglycosylase B|nr:lytic murein transglycosylase B [Francisellaceae bacterium]
MGKVCKYILLTAMILTPYARILADSDFHKREDVNDFISYMEKKHHYSKTELTKIFSQVSSSQEIINKISKPAEGLTWDRYRKIFISDKRIKAGAKFWKENLKLLEKAEAKYHVPADIIVSIIGVETFYGEMKGGYPVVQALATLAFDYPRRAKFFRSELEAFLLLSKENNLDTLNLEGSYAGAIGIAQFMPSSYRAYARNFENKGSVDLINNKAHAIASVGNYLREFGWKDNQEVIHKAYSTSNKYQDIKAPHHKPKPEYNLKALAQYNVFPQTKSLSSKDTFALIEFTNGQNNDLYLAQNNFYVITRYNHSSNYALAVYQLAGAIKAEFNKLDS